MGRKRIADLLTEHEHLVGLEVADGRRRRIGFGEIGRVTEVAIKEHRPIITVDFPESGKTKLWVVGRRVPKALNGKIDSRIHLHRFVNGEQAGRFTWVRPDAALNAPPPPAPEPQPEPHAVFQISIDAQTWPRAAAKRQQAMAETLVERLAVAIENALAGARDELPDVLVEQSAIRRNAGAYFDLVIRIDVFESDSAVVDDLYARVVAMLGQAAEDEPGSDDHWPTACLRRDEQDLRQIRTSRFRLDGLIGDSPLPAADGYFRVR